MNRPRFRGLVSFVSVVVLSLVFANAAAFDGWPPRWHVNGNGATGILEISVGEGGVLTGSLLGEMVEGYVSGRHVVLRRGATGDDRTEVWEGWLGRPAGEGMNLIVAGTITVSQGETTQVYPWFGTIESPTTASGAAAPTGSTAVIPAQAPASQPAPPPRGRIAGYWEATEGKIEVQQNDKTLTVIMPDGSALSGRMTGEDTLIVGIRKGCCNGRLAGADVIDWSDGSRWRRAD